LRGKTFFFAVGEQNGQPAWQLSKAKEREGVFGGE